MQFDVISSGSKGNATIIISHGHVLLIDFGISKRRISTSLKEYGFSFDDLEAIFITHTHSDHASNVASAPMEKLYAPQKKLPGIEETIDPSHFVSPFQEFEISVFKVKALPMSHDCPNTMAYLVSDGEEELAIVTDTGFIPEKSQQFLMGKDYYIFESNHDPEMLYQSKRPEYLIRRIISDKGHLSNTDASYYLSTFITSNTKEVILAHLSDECNKPSIAMNVFEQVMQVQLGYIPSVLLRCASDLGEEVKGGR
ncbi:MAG: MBL fold metallo-hydrolase [Bacilli bacterium]|nr:MBL fold metallo-hydrolase [Bacilli bacterium]